MSARNMSNLLLELIERQCGFDGLIVNNRAISDMFVDIFSDVGDSGGNRLALNNGLNSLVDMVMGLMLCVCCTLDDRSFRRSNLLVISQPSMLLSVTGNILIGHGCFMAMMFSLERLMLVLRGQNFSIFDRLNAVLVMVNLVFAGDVLVDFLLFIRSNSFVRHFRFNLRLDSGVVMLSGREDLKS